MKLAVGLFPLNMFIVRRFFLSLLLFYFLFGKVRAIVISEPVWKEKHNQLIIAFLKVNKMVKDCLVFSIKVWVVLFAFKLGIFQYFWYSPAHESIENGWEDRVDDKKKNYLSYVFSRDLKNIVETCSKNYANYRTIAEFTYFLEAKCD